jgi:hypothetical protein
MQRDGSGPGLRQPWAGSNRRALAKLVSRGRLWTSRLQTRDPQRPTATRCLNLGPPDVTRIKPTAANRVQAHRWRRRLGLRCLTVRLNDRIVRHLISTGYLSLESRDVAASVAFALEAWISDSVT